MARSRFPQRQQAMAPYRSTMRSCGAAIGCFALALVLSMAPCAAAQAPTGLQQGVTFTAYTPLAGNAERMRRLLSPLTTWRMQRQWQKAHQRLSEQAIDLAQERFALYVPSGAPPPGGYALLVFVSPWDDARVPRQWLATLDRHATIFVSAAHSGNDIDVLNRREPLAILAAYNVMQHYHVNPQRVYASGFSGGSRVALRLALSYPDLFRGALLDAGSDPIGTAEIPLPPAELMQIFQQDSRLTFLTGGDDSLNLARDAHSRDSLKAWCVFDVDVEAMRHVGHDVAEGRDFNRALSALERHASPDPGKLHECRGRNAEAMAQQFLQAQTMIDQNRPDDARDLLERIDAHYGGLAAPRSVELMKKIEAPH